jgi:hypothetical protein
VGAILPLRPQLRLLRSAGILADNRWRSLRHPFSQFYIAEKSSRANRSPAIARRKSRDALKKEQCKDTIDFYALILRQDAPQEQQKTQSIRQLPSCCRAPSRYLLH